MRHNVRCEQRLPHIENCFAILPTSDLFRYTKSSASAGLFVFVRIILSIVGVDVLGDPKERPNKRDAREVVPYKKRQGGSICKNSAVLFTFHRFYGIIQLIDKLEFVGENGENLIYDWRHDGSGQNNCVPTA